jgi:hypothetical protein
MGVFVGTGVMVEIEVAVGRGVSVGGGGGQFVLHGGRGVGVRVDVGAGVKFGVTVGPITIGPRSEIGVGVGATTLVDAAHAARKMHRAQINNAMRWHILIPGAGSVTFFIVSTLSSRLRNVEYSSASYDEAIS